MRALPAFHSHPGGLLTASAALLALSWAAACGDGPPAPGFQGVGGESSDATSGVTSSTTGDATSSAVTGTTGITSSTVTGTTTTVASSSTGPACDDTGDEPNETEQTAHNLGDISDCDGSGDSVSGVITGFGDVDWFKYHASDNFGCSVDPSRSLTSDLPVRLCKFIQCDDNTAPHFDCPDGSDAASSPDGRPGCCSDGGMSFDMYCGGSSQNDDPATVYLRVDSPTGSACAHYTLDYHY